VKNKFLINIYLKKKKGKKKFAPYHFSPVPSFFKNFKTTLQTKNKFKKYFPKLYFGKSFLKYKILYSEKYFSEIF